MEKKKEFKISLKTALIGIISIIIIIGIVLCRIAFNYDNITEYEGDYKKISYRSSMDARFTSIISQNGNSIPIKNIQLFQIRKNLILY